MTSRTDPRVRAMVGGLTEKMRCVPERQLAFTPGERLWIITADYQRIESTVVIVDRGGLVVLDSLGNWLPMRWYGVNWGKVE